MIYSIMLYARNDNPNNDKFVKLLSERFLLPVTIVHSETDFCAFVWGESYKEEMKLQKRVDKYFNRIKKRYG